MWYLVKGLCEIHDGHIGLPLITIQGTIQVAYQVMVETGPTGFRKTSDFGNHAYSQQEFFQRIGACYVAYYYMLKEYATDACKRHRAIICSYNLIIFFTFLENRRHIRLSPMTWYSALSKRLTVHIKVRIGAISELN